MLVLLFRGIFLIGILSWYSTNVWKMIDGYFKERFDKYLQREFQKNPKMRDDVIASKSSGEESKNVQISEKDAEKTKTDSLIHPEKEPCHTVGNYREEICAIDPTTMEKMADDHRTGAGSLSPMLSHNHALADETKVIEKNEVDKSASAENTIDATMSDVIKEVLVNENDIDKIANHKTVQPIKIFVHDHDDNGGSKMKPDEPESGSKVTVANRDDSSIDTKKPPVRRTKLKTKQRIKSKIDEEKENKEKKKKKRVKTIVFTEEDFKRAKIRSGLQDYDFSEFDDEDEESSHEPQEGILVSQLPFKPRADIGNLERVTDDEFCPLTLDNDADCGEIKTWP